MGTYMSGTDYKKILIIYLVAYLLLYFIDFYESNLVSKIVFYSNHLLFSFVFFFGVYAYKAAVKTNNKLISPVMLIVIGAVILVVTFALPIYNYSVASSNLKRESVALEKAKVDAISLNMSVGERVLAARQYYIETGQTVTFLDDKNQPIQYLPNEDTIENKRKVMDLKSKERSTVAELKETTFKLIAILLFSTITFTFFIFKKHWSA